MAKKPYTKIVPSSRQYAGRVSKLSVLAILSASTAAIAQPTPPATASSAAAPTEETINLPQFTITETPANPYQSRTALSATRVAMEIQDIPQTISVVSSDFIRDTFSDRMLDAAKYVTPVVESTLPFGGDRYTIRGFTVSAEFIDGTNISGADGYSMSLSPVNIERLEIIKGPNAILVPGGSPGGVINPITKAPINKNQGSATISLSRYADRSFSFDVNRVLDSEGKMAARLVYAIWRNEYYTKNHYRHGYEIAPSFSYQLSPDHKFILKADFVQNRESNGVGLPIDPSVGSNQFARTPRGLPRDWSFGDDVDTRHRSTERISAELLSTLSDHITSRLHVMANHVRRYDVGGANAGLSNAGGGSRNPFTGLYEPGVNWGPGITAYNASGNPADLVPVSAPVTDPSTWIYIRNNGKVDLEYTEAHLKNDYAAIFETNWFKSTTLLGFAANTSKVRFKSYPAARRPDVPANNLGSITYPAYAFPGIQPGFTNQSFGTDRSGKMDDLQMFAMETLGFWENRIQLSGGVSRFFGNLSRTDTNGTAVNAAFPNQPDYHLTTNATSFGVSVRPIKPVTLFYGRNTTGAGMPGSLNAGVTDPNQKFSKGGQREYGVKTSLFEDRLTASFAYFDIEQTNFQVTNSEFFRLQSLGLPTTDQPQFLLFDLNSKGWEFETTFAVNRSLTLVGNYSSVKIRQPITDVRLRGVPDKSWATYIDYRFKDGPLDGFGFNLGVDFKGDVAGENTSGYTTNRPLPNGTFVPQQPSFLVEDRTLVNVGFTYQREKWSAAFTVMNALDEEYVMAAGSRGTINVGQPRDFRATVTYKF
jgi:iron complex outermembrane recepter protein